MARLARIVAPGFPQHITQRGNRRREVFCRAADHQIYLAMLRKYQQRDGLAIYAYCLMPNHIHLVAVPAEQTSRAGSLRDTHTADSSYINRSQACSGQLWQGRCFSCVLAEAHLWAAVRYVERNPVRAGLVKRAADYPWSSAAAHCLGKADPVLSPGFPPPGIIRNWCAWLEEEPPEATDYLRRQTHVVPVAALPSSQPWKGLLHRCLQPLPRGPKPKQRTAEAI